MEIGFGLIPTTDKDRDWDIGIWFLNETEPFGSGEGQTGLGFLVLNQLVQTAGFGNYEPVPNVLRNLTKAQTGKLIKY